MFYLGCSKLNQNSTSMQVLVKQHELWT